MNAPAVNPVSALSVRDHIDQHAASDPDGAFLIDPSAGHIVTYSQCQSRVRAVASFISAKGLKSGDPVAYACNNSTDAALLILGILYGGYTATAINLVSGDSTIAYVLEHSQSKLVFFDNASHSNIASIVSALAQRPQMISIEDINHGSGNGAVGNTVPPDSDGLLMYTSGTTGRPKGVVLTQANLLAGGANTVAAHQLSARDRGLCVLPFYHINAFCVSLMGALVSGGSLVVPPKFSVSTFWNTIRQTECSWFSVVPTQISYLLHNADKPDGDSTGCDYLRFGRSASAPLSPDMHSAFEARFAIPVIETMGLTETAAQILSNPLPPGTRKIGSPGIPFGNEVMIADEQQNEVPAGREGEILVRGPNVLKGYLNNDDATKQALTNKGWLRTGDLGRMDKDGYVFVTGRLKELIIKGGENIAPREIDEALYLHPDVMEAAAFAVPCPDYGQRVEAGVKLRENASADPDALLEICRENIGAFKSPDRVHILPDLPKGPSGKIQRIKLAEMFNDD